MGMIEWEPEVEYFNLDSSPRPVAVIQPYAELPFCLLAGQDSLFGYDSTNDRTVVMRVLGFSATSPMVQAVIKQAGGVEKVRKGELVGCRHPEEPEIITGALRTNHLPVPREVGRNSGLGLLPLAIKGLRIMPM